MLERLWHIHHHALSFSFPHVRLELLSILCISAFPPSFSFSQIHALFFPLPFTSVQSTFPYQRGTSADFLLFIRILRFYFSLFKFHLLTSLQEKTHSYWTSSLLRLPSTYSSCVTKHLSSKSFVVLCLDWLVLAAMSWTFEDQLHHSAYSLQDPLTNATWLAYLILCWYSDSYRWLH